jgi:uncharacterized protein
MESPAMFVEFSVSNFRSIRTRQTLSMAASPDTKHLQQNVTSPASDELRLLRSAVIYGPNAAGKSNLLLALEVLQQLVQNSATGIQEGQRLPVTPYLFSKECIGQPSEFEIIFFAEDGIRYDYCCVVSAERVHKEWLVAYPLGRPQRWFEREYVTKTNTYDWWFGPNFKAERAERRIWPEFTRANALFISTAIQLNNEQLKPVFAWMTQKLIVLTPGKDFNPFLSLELLREDSGKAKIMDFMRAADIGIDRLELREEELPAPTTAGALSPGAVRVHFEFGIPLGAIPSAHKRFRVLAWHRYTDSNDEVPLDIGDESDGTRKLFEFTGGWLRALEWGATLFVDELDRSLHPHMTRFLVKFFQSRKNDKNAQLVFTTHDTTLLDTDLLRRDQIWFVEKDEHRSSHFYSLLEYSPRKDEALERGYLKGRYGAIPFIGNIGDR